MPGCTRHCELLPPYAQSRIRWAAQPSPRRKDIKLCNHNKVIGRAEGVPDLGIDASRNSACSKSAGILPESICLTRPRIRLGLAIGESAKVS
ncbi:uncharacterized protein RAG0_13292 [Rhynchosporium agropyri]|uniref:Uncharacterized protein n=1 Tax=Rhynchosporium agropyri TaxID=914238 RepID=A0A1E1LCD3_9HELO|nr:uncharacterized protein RAG0_13292 [Rhynchosporium agropyri]